MSGSRVISRLTSCSSSLSSTLRRNATQTAISQLKSNSQAQLSDSTRRFSSRISRLPTVLSSLGTMMPLHSAIASARLRSILSVESQSWGLIPQGISMPL